MPSVKPLFLQELLWLFVILAKNIVFAKGFASFKYCLTSTT
ncbi:hypothetical protein C942_02477 [Photobacterium marinum]|uniref:Uncharacterized protein n=1 Tax=Photobacterium marinum TaxID=1056511 RepID=L8J8D4_9GAMM|nr:hypothetical protein C942_02477 [Photobacterium marinum]